MTVLARARRCVRRFLRRRDGAATVEFVVVFPAIFFFLLNTLETSIVLTRVTLLDRALDLAVRDLRIGVRDDMSLDQFRTLVCARAQGIPNCEGSIAIELRPNDPAGRAAMATATECVDRSEPLEPLTEAVPTGGANEMMLIRLCASYEPAFPAIGLGAAMPRDGNGDYRLTAFAAFVQEP